MGILNIYTLDLSEALRQPLPTVARNDEDHLLSRARADARTWGTVTRKCHTAALMKKYRDADRMIRQSIRKLRKRSLKGDQTSAEAKCLLESSSLLITVLRDVRRALTKCGDLPGVESAKSGKVPRAYVAMESYLRAVKFDGDAEGISAYLSAVQQSVPFLYAELWMLGTFSQLTLLERIGAIAKNLCSDRERPVIFAAPTLGQFGGALKRLTRCLRQCSDLDWNEVIEEVSVTEEFLRRDPLGVYSKMAFESRDLYRKVVADLAGHSLLSEQDIASEAMRLAKTTRCISAPHARERRLHIGYYLVDDGLSSLKRAIGYRPSGGARVRQAVLDHPDFFYALLIQLGVLFVVALTINGVRVKFLTFTQLILLLLPAIECALAVTNLLVTRVVPPRRLPKLDFSKGIPNEDTTLVVVPALLTSKEQVENAVRDLEIRYLGNRDRNLHFALVTDLPDSMTECDEKDTLAEVCSGLIDSLNAEYGANQKGSFFHLHRHRVYNSSEGIWMGWERKRGKLLDLNNLLLGKSDNFPVKVGNLPLLRLVKYVITLDLDTQLPRESARKLVGTLAHPLNKAVIDPVTNTVVEGYGILQPRVGISINSANRSRLAAMFSTDARFDIYTRAVSDVYHDLFGEGIFTGKGIYEVDSFQRVLEHRFPCNAILSHDLIEGAYARTGLVSDIDVIDDYPTHTSAYNRRKHRWVRGDWQILIWLFPRVPDNSGKLVHNPLRPLSRWKIADNLRRSLTESATFALLIYGFFHVPQKALEWTLACIAILVLPTYIQSCLTVVSAGRLVFTRRFWKEMVSDLAHAHAELLSRLILLCHQSFVTLDAIVRALIRMTFTHKRLLQWETALEAELTAKGKDPVETYFVWTSVLSLVVGILLAVIRPASLAVGLPFLSFWSLSVLFCRWLDRPLRVDIIGLHGTDKALLRRASLRTWRFFREFCTAEEHWLIPDIITEAPVLVAHRISPTNLGLLLNSRIAAYDLGFLTLPEFVEATGKTIGTARNMVKCNGHFYNWYDTQNLEPVNERFISSVDSGNLLCSLWTLKRACIEATKEPLFRRALWEGMHDHLQSVHEYLLGREGDAKIAKSISGLKARLKLLNWSNSAWIQALPALEIDILSLETAVNADEAADGNLKWWAHELLTRITSAKQTVEDVAPWLSLRFANCLLDFGIHNMPPADELTLESSLEFHTTLVMELQGKLRSEQCILAERSLIESLLSSLEISAKKTAEIAEKLHELSESASSLAERMDFACLYNPVKRMLSIGLNVDEGRQKENHYDLLASEARSAVFVAIAKGDIPQESWLRLGRTQTVRQDERILLSWSGTMFEYLMPALWMKSYPNTVLEQCERVAIRAQQAAARKRSIPWGISESSCFEKNPDGHYRYHPFGLPGLALSRDYSGDLVVSPYSSFLALHTNAADAIRNLSEMEHLGWLGTYGFFEAGDYTPSRVRSGNRFEIVRCWMAHHQGMSLVSAANVLCESSIQSRFHNEPQVSATERLLQEKFGGEPIPEFSEEAGVADSAVLAHPPTSHWWKTAGLVLSGESTFQRNR